MPTSTREKPPRFPFRAVGVDAYLGAKSRALRGCASKLACGRRIDPPENARFHGNPMQIRIILTFFVVGADDPVRPRKTPVFTEIQCEIVTFWRADRVVRPYKRL